METEEIKLKNTIKLEELAMFGLSIYLFSLTSYEWWWYLVWILVPDLSMIGYIINTKVGAIAYNIAHHKLLAIGILIIGWYMTNPELELAGIILFGHSSMDRLFGYGLKYSDDFKHTHLGWLK